MPDRSLIVKKEWLDLIFEGVKPLEMRSKATNMVGTIGLIEKGSGLIMGECFINGSLPRVSSKREAERLKHLHHVDDLDQIVNKWAYPWMVSNAQRYDKPVPYDHPQGAVIWVDTSAISVCSIELSDKEIAEKLAKDIESASYREQSQLEEIRKEIEKMYGAKHYQTSLSAPAYSDFTGIEKALGMTYSQWVETHRNGWAQ